LSKRRRNFWDDETYESKANGLYQEHDEAELELVDHAESSEFLEEAHEALSKLFNKTTKRSKQMRGLRRNDAWQ